MRIKTTLIIRIFAITSAIVFVISNIGCIPMASHHGSDLTKIDEFKIEKNKTKESELVEKFGPPATTTLRGDGSKTLIWSSGSVKSHINAAGVFIPFAWLADNEKTKVDTKSFVATIQNGVVVDYSLNSSSQKY